MIADSNQLFDGLGKILGKRGDSFILYSLCQTNFDTSI